MFEHLTPKAKEAAERLRTATEELAIACTESRLPASLEAAVIKVIESEGAILAALDAAEKALDSAIRLASDLNGLLYDSNGNENRFDRYEELIRELAESLKKRADK